MGIFRTIQTKRKTDKDNKVVLPVFCKETEQFIKNWNSVYGQYTLFSEDNNMQHELLNTKVYTHITSPIRRLIDLLNHIIFFKEHSMILNLSKDGEDFLRKWLCDVENINETMKSVMKVERECEIVRKCLTNPELLDNVHEAIVLNIREIEMENRIMYKYFLYLEKEKIVLTMKSEIKKELYQREQIKLYKIESYSVYAKIKIGWHVSS